MPNLGLVTRRIVVALLFLLALATPALGDDIAKKRAVDAHLANLQGNLDATRKSEAVIRDRIAALDNRIGGLESQVGTVSLHLAALQRDLMYRRQRLADLNRLFRLETRRLDELKKQYSRAVRRLNDRLVAIYESDQPSTLDFVLGSTSIDEALDMVDFVNLIGAEDKKIAAEVKHSKLEMQSQRAQTKRVSLKVRGDERALAARATQEQEARDALVGARNDLAQTKSEQATNLSKLSAHDRSLADEIAQEQASSAALASAIRAAQAQAAQGPPATPSSAGLIWPVSGPVTSPFGPRWGSFHQGIDIGVPTGTPIAAAAAGTVIYCGWESGYGNLVVIDHGGSLATAYGHQSSIAVSCGQHVEQGQTIGYVGCTGHCFGPHLHFEVRINGSPVDPLGYL
ncbi:MAG TPA: peptidoglycan DD-metalloendopeptidase family protein [Gaiellaceae bacterium]